MRSDIAIRVECVGKVYNLRKHGLQLWRRKQPAGPNSCQALRNVSFTVKRGESVGVVGRNGSGKTTLLQIICGTLRPSTGRVELNGKVAALLALGAGFNPEYTGRENVYLYSSLLGMSKTDIDARYDAICDFADIDHFIEQPVKTYSSGMFMRLAFSVAVHVEPDILIVDEALAVGDEAFQRKCFARLEKLKENGMSLLFVSHSANAIINLCDRAILFDSGRLLAEGTPKRIISIYQKLIYASKSNAAELIRNLEVHEDEGLDNSASSACNIALHLNNLITQPRITDKPHAHFVPNMQSQSRIEYESMGALIYDTRIESPDGTIVNFLCSGEQYIYIYNVRFDVETDNLMFGMLIKTVDGINIGGASTRPMGSMLAHAEKGNAYELRFRFDCRLNPGVYFMNAGVQGDRNGEYIYLHRILDSLMFRVVSVDEGTATAIVDFSIQAAISSIKAI